MPKKLNLEGVRFGRLVAISRSQTHSGRARWTCLCDCGKSHEVEVSKLTTGNTSSCGCYRREVERSAYSHGHQTGGTSPTYTSWASMWGRCRDSSNMVYGSRGISVCDRWKSFEMFLLDMGERPKGFSLDRIENNLGYSPENCQWATRTVQNNNRRCNINLEHAGRSQTLSQWCSELNLNYSAMYSRVKLRGMTLSDAITKPSRKPNVSKDLS